MTEFRKNDNGKSPLGLLPWKALSEVADVLLYGAEKYSAHNWRKGTQWSRYYNASLRHITAWIEGEDLDQESERNHLAHAICGLLFLLTFQKERIGTDDRFSSCKEDSPLRDSERSSQKPKHYSSQKVPVGDGYPQP